MPSLVVAEVQVRSIKIGRGRLLDENHVEQLMLSMQEVGLLEAVVIAADGSLVAGYHRLKAAQRLGWDTIPATTFDGTELQRQIATIDENLIRRVLTVAERSELLAERKRLYEAAHPETRPVAERGGPGRGKTSAEPAPVSFAADTAAKTGRGRRTIEEEVRIGEKLAPDVMETVKAGPVADQKALLLGLADMAPQEQRETLKAAKTVDAVKAEIRRRGGKHKATRRKSVAKCDHRVVRCEGCGKLIKRAK